MEKYRGEHLASGKLRALLRWEGTRSARSSCDILEQGTFGLYLNQKPHLELFRTRSVPLVLPNAGVLPHSIQLHTALFEP